MEKRGDLPGALDVFEKALEIDEENKMARFRKARVLMGMERYHVSCPPGSIYILETKTKTELYHLTGRPSHPRTPLQSLFDRAFRPLPPRQTLQNTRRHPVVHIDAYPREGP